MRNNISNILTQQKLNKLINASIIIINGIYHFNALLAKIYTIIMIILLQIKFVPNV
jgi:hypothetical protein